MYTVSNSLLQFGTFKPSADVTEILKTAPADQDATVAKEAAYVFPFVQCLPPCLDANKPQKGRIQGREARAPATSHRGYGGHCCEREERN